MVKTSSMPFKKQFMPAQNAQWAAQNAQIRISPDATPLAFAELKTIQPYAQQYHATWLTTPFPEIATKYQIRPIAPAIFTKPVKYHWMQWFHLDILLDVIRIERNVPKYR